MAILAQLQRLFTPRPERQQAQAIYIALVEQSRNPVFYEKWEVPDSLDGRYEMIVLHLFLTLEAMKTHFDRQPELQEIGRQLIESFIADMDRSLREMGAGDTGVGKRVKAMISGFYGRMDAYRAAELDEAQWLTALRRNAYATSPQASEAGAKKLADYAMASAQSLPKGSFTIGDDARADIQFQNFKKSD